ncbi:MAG: recombinase RecA [Clostridia bacterium]|nr:recombinase RecA [Clostridia bacterium]
MAEAKEKKVKGEPSSKEEALQQALASLDKRFGKGSVMKMGEKPTMNVSTISTGCLELDIALGVKGLPRGRIVEIYGPESSGKTTIALHCVTEAQKNGGTAAYIDVENALDPVYAKKIGVDIDNLYISQPDTGEDALEIMDTLVSSGAIDMVVIDSVAALVPRAEIEGGMGDAHVGVQARLMSQALRKLTGTINKTKCVAIFINQLREKVGVVYGNPEVTPGGRALKFYSSVRIEIRKGEAIKNGENVLGNVTKAKIAKNKVAPPFKTASFDLMYGEGVSNEGSLVNVGSELGILEKSGSWYSYKGERIAQGKENVKKYLAENPAVADEIKETILNSMTQVDGTSSQVAADGEIISSDDDTFIE